MKNTNEKNGNMGKSIPRNPNIPITDDEVNSLLKKAAEQVAGKEKQSQIKVSDVQEQKKKVEHKNTNVEKLQVKNIDTKKSTVTQVKDVGNENKKSNTKVSQNENKKSNTKVSQNENKKLDTRVSQSENKKLDTRVLQSENRKSDIKVSQDKKANSKYFEDRKTDIQKKDSTKLYNKESEDRKKDVKKLKEGADQRNLELQKKTSSINDSKPWIEDSNKNSKEFKVEEDVIVTDSNNGKKNKIRIGDFIGSVLEGIWICVKLFVLVIIVTAVVGFFLSRDLMVRGRSGERLSTVGMNISTAAVSNKSECKELAKTWSQSAILTKLTLKADDGSILVARKVVGDKTNDKWAVILHGHNGSMEDIYDIAMRYTEKDYNVLMPDLRANGESEGSIYGMGWLDRLDVINWVDVILEENPSAQIVIHGIDVGASTALMLSGEPLKSSIKAIVAEGAYTSAWDAIEIEYKIRHENWPVFPIMNMMNPVMKIWAGYDLKEADVVAQVQKASVPILLIRGQNDTYISENMTQDILQSIASEHELLTIGTGTHDDCRFAEPDTYYNKTFEFVGKYIQ